MKITKHGKKHDEKYESKTFKCKECNCEFTAGKDEFYEHTTNSWDDAQLSGTICASYKIKHYICSCPECHKIIHMTETKTDYLNCSVTADYNNHTDLVTETSTNTHSVNNKD